MRQGSFGVSFKGLLIVVILATAGITAFFVFTSDVSSDDSFCPPGSVLHPPAGTCINPSALLVTGSVAEVTEAVSVFDGRVLYSIGDIRFVMLPDEDLDNLDEIKDALTVAGLKVDYVLIGQLHG